MTAWTGDDVIDDALPKLRNNLMYVLFCIGQWVEAVLWAVGNGHDYSTKIVLKKLRFSASFFRASCLIF